MKEEGRGRKENGRKGKERNERRKEGRKEGGDNGLLFLSFFYIHSCKV